MYKTWNVKAKKLGKRGSAQLLEGYQEWFKSANIQEKEAEAFFSSYFAGISTDTIFEFTVVQISNGYRVQEPVLNKEEDIKDRDLEGWEELEETWFSPEEIETLGVIDHIIATGGFANVQMIGQSGLGKTQRAISWAKKAGLNFCKVNCGGIMTPKNWGS